jgi:hypothetical protein
MGMAFKETGHGGLRWDKEGTGSCREVLSSWGFGLFGGLIYRVGRKCMGLGYHMLSL